MVAHALNVLSYVGPFGPLLPQPPNLTSLGKLQYTIARTNVMHTSIVAHALTCLPNIGACGPNIRQTLITDQRDCFFILETNTETVLLLLIRLRLRLTIWEYRDEDFAILL